jgi:hypothetical protein
MNTEKPVVPQTNTNGIHVLRQLPEEQGIIIHLDRPRRIRMDFNVLATIETETGRSAIGGRLFTNLNVTDLRTILWACLRVEDATLTLEDVGAMCTLDRIEEITDAIGQLVKQAYPAKKSGTKADGDKGDTENRPLDGQTFGQ